jgi:Putative adhesin
MSRWVIDSPAALDFDGAVALRVRIVSGSVAVLATAGRPCLEVTSVSGEPLLVTHEAGILTVSYEDLSWDGVLGWLRPQRHDVNVTVMVPRECPAQLGVVTATAVVAGLSARTSLKSVSGDITLDGVTGAVDSDTVSGSIEVEGLDGSVVFRSVSGDLTLADGRLERLDAKTVSGRVTADVELTPAAELTARTLTGDVALRLPAGTSARAELRSASGRMYSDFDGLDLPPMPGRKTVSGTLGGGSGRISVSTMSGDVTILQRSPRPGTDTGDAEGPAAMPTGGTTVEGDG